MERSYSIRCNANEAFAQESCTKTVCERALAPCSFYTFRIQLLLGLILVKLQGIWWLCRHGARLLWRTWAGSSMHNSQLLAQATKHKCYLMLFDASEYG